MVLVCFVAHPNVNKTFDYQYIKTKKSTRTGAFYNLYGIYFTSISSTSKMSVAFGGITPPAPLSP
jgi:hypothetical protein